ncbi:hypothetical protein BUALT_Bualt03G0146300 [Buddleja alternifolia]|uniref:Uncharacterized protein n=1 Tax=Buddleja alternifolia TaxID=168488 RepID=A0AAV6XUR6_9LAMI|nr:hypothetical protein BUALT_Bualt03G0146300 [Buddleja alternifolia]
MISSSPFTFITTTLSLFFLIQRVNSQLPATRTFTFINHGDFAEGVAEYGATYSEIRNEVYNFDIFPFSLCFYNTTPGAYVLAIRGGVPGDRREPIRWVWDANRRRPVGENATLSLRRDGNLVLAESNGVIANGRRRLVSRDSDADGSDGPYSLVFEEPGIIMYLNYSGELIRYADWLGYTGNKVTFTTLPENYVNSTVYDLLLKYDEPPPESSRDLNITLQKLNYNATYSFLRLGSDGNVKIFTYNGVVRYPRWEQSFAYFPDYHVRECALPSRCGQFGLCDRGMCVACPSPKGLLGWSEGCAPPQLGQCGGGGKVGYYEIRGAEHFLTLLVSADGQMTVAECRRRCSRDCKCKGFVYQENTSLCLTVPLLATLIREVNTSVVYVKYLK